MKNKIKKQIEEKVCKEIKGKYDYIYENENDEKLFMQGMKKTIELTSKQAEKEMKENIVEDFIDVGMTYEGSKSMIKSRKHFVNGLKGFINFKVNWERNKKEKEIIEKIEKRLKVLNKRLEKAKDNYEERKVEGQKGFTLAKCYKVIDEKMVKEFEELLKSIGDEK